MRNVKNWCQKPRRNNLSGWESKTWITNLSLGYTWSAMAFLFCWCLSFLYVCICLLFCICISFCVYLPVSIFLFLCVSLSYSITYLYIPYSLFSVNFLLVKHLSSYVSFIVCSCFSYCLFLFMFLLLLFVSFYVYFFLFSSSNKYLRLADQGQKESRWNANKKIK